ncbi:uncharacterized protein LOC100199358 isoform X1 [Hydra vulgaris]|uniref:uncharacterized protein LOC100199358 isoform X1 n=1 Tax=Hydra vulgaris TaxID=6087 RepID=UPI00064170C1|nr:uncharacterized protein LOC100199358 isoform X1 [Hydra vulgaris]
MAARKNVNIKNESKVVQDVNSIQNKMPNEHLIKKIKKKDKEKNSSWKYILSSSLKCIAFILVLPPFLNFAALIQEEKSFKPEGIMIDVRHGQKLYKSCYGQGTPTVILDAPIGYSSDIWNLIYPEIAKITKVCIYDRAGLGYSEKPKLGNETKNGGHPYTVERMVEDFHRLFDVEEKPLVLVGANLGASIAKFYTQVFSNSVAYGVFINPIFEELFLGEDNPWNKYWFHSLLPSLQLKHFSAALGLSRIGLQTGVLNHAMNYDTVNIDVIKRQKYLQCKPGHVSSIVEEHFYLNESLSQLRMLHKLRPFPRMVPVQLIWTSKYSDSISNDKNEIWLKSCDIYTKDETNPNVKSLKLKGSLEQVLLTKHQTVVQVIVKILSTYKNTKNI